MAIKYTDEELLDNLKLIANDLGYTPLYREYKSHPKSFYGLRAYKCNFGTWTNAVLKANLKPRRISKNKTTINKLKKQIIKDLQKATNQLEHVPTTTEYKNIKWVKYNLWHVQRTFGTYNKAVIAAGLKPRKYGDTLHCKQLSKQKKEQFLQILYETAITHPELHSVRSIMILTPYGETTTYLYFKSTAELKQELYNKYGIKIEKQPPLSMQLNVYIDAIKQYYNIYKKVPKYYEVEKFSGLCFRSLCYGGHTKRKKSENRINISYSELVYKALGKINARPVKTDNIPMKKIIIADLQEKYASCKNMENLTYKKFVREICKNPKKKLIRYFGSIVNALKAAKIPLRPTKVNGVIYSDKDIIKVIRKIAKNIGHNPNSVEYDKHPYRTARKETIIKRFGNWTNALKTAGLKNVKDHKESTKEEIIAEIQRIAKLIKHSPNSREYNEYNQNTSCASAIEKRFGSWNNAILAAGLIPTRQCNQAFTKKEILDSIKAVVNDLNRIPLEKEYAKHPFGVCSNTVLRRNFDSWNKALIAAGLKEEKPAI